MVVMVEHVTKVGLWLKSSFNHLYLKHLSLLKWNYILHVTFFA